MPKEITKETPKKAVDLFEKGEQALDNSNYDYAIPLFEGALSVAPFYSVCRRKLRLAQFKKYDLEHPPIFVTYLKLILGAVPFLKAHYYFSKEYWSKAINELEKILLIHPKNKFVLLKLAQTAERNGMIDISIDTLNALRLVDQRDVSTIKELARIHKDLGHLNDARLCYEDVLSISPDDPDASPELRKIAALGTIKQSSWDRLESFREKIKDEEQAKLFEKEAKHTKSEDELNEIIYSLERKLDFSPDNLDTLSNLSELYFQTHDYNKAAEYIKKCISLSPSDLTYKDILAQIESKSIDLKIHKIKEQLVDSPENNDLQTTLKNLEQKKTNLLLASCLQQVEQFPTNLNLRFDLGSLYMKTGMIDKAITEFQLAVKNPNKTIQTLNNLGVCFTSKKMFDLAIEQYSTAIESLTEMTPLKKDIIYNLAATYEEMGKIPEALNEYKKIYTIDISFKDVAEKIEKTYKNRF
ncbi:MAG: hypothetical protein P9M13_08745 [Candidatus Ancaeobacter aquaticus]|nr:hypothetical protein [Candidatus Ancaeobacter aquaticus]